MEMSTFGVAMVEFGPVADRELHRLFWLGWDVTTTCARPPVVSGVYP